MKSVVSTKNSDKHKNFNDDGKLLILAFETLSYIPVVCGKNNTSKPSGKLSKEYL